MSIKRRKIAHTPFAVDRDIANEMEEKFRAEFEKCSSNRFRNADDMMFMFSYAYFIIGEKKWSYEIVEDDESWTFVSVHGNRSEVLEAELSKIELDKNKKFLCLNDDIDYSNRDEAQLLNRKIFEFFESIFPIKSSFEKK